MQALATIRLVSKCGRGPRGLSVEVEAVPRGLGPQGMAGWRATPRGLSVEVEAVPRGLGPQGMAGWRAVRVAPAFSFSGLRVQTSGECCPSFRISS